MTLGKTYRQEGALSWGYLTPPDDAKRRARQADAAPRAGAAAPTGGASAPMIDGATPLVEELAADPIRCALLRAAGPAS